MYRVLIIGCGAIAGGYDNDRPSGAWPLTHAGAFAHDHRFVVAACIDPDEEKRKAFAARWGIERQAAGLAELGAQPGDFDVVSICSPTAMHVRHLEAALALRPKLIFCEKPVAEELGEAERLVAECARAGVALAVNYTRRWAPDIAELAVQLEAGEWGRVLSAVGWYAKGIVHNGGHLVDLLHLLLGELRLVAAGAPRLDHWESDPSVPALLAAGGGTSVHLVPGDASAFTVFELVLTCERGEIAIRDGGRRIEIRAVSASDTYAGHRELGEGEVRPGRYAEAMTLAVANIGDALEAGKPLASTGENGLAAQRLCEAIRIASFDLAKESPAR